MKKLNKIIKNRVLPAIAILTLAFSIMAITQTNAISLNNKVSTPLQAIKHDKKINHPLDEGNETDDNGGGDNGGEDNGGGDGHDDGTGEHENETEHNEEDNEKVEFHHGDGNETIDSDDNTIKFESNVPKLKMEYNIVINNVTYQVTIKVRSTKIIEFVDRNNNNIIDPNETLYTFDFDESDWVLNTTFIEDANGTVIGFKFTYTHVDQNYGVSISFLVFNKTIGLIDGGADKVKVEMNIYKWMWHSNDSKLAYQFKAEISLENEIFNGVYNATTGLNDYSIYISLDNQSFVQYSWNNTVVIDGTPTDVLNSYVKKYESEIETEEGETEVELEIRNIVVFPRFNQTLYYDPIIGIEDDPQDVSALATQFNLTISTPGGTISPLPNVFGDGVLIALGLVSSILILLIGIALVRRKNN